MQAKPYHLWEFDSHLVNYEKASHHRLFTDATVTVDGHDFQLHKHVLATGSPVFERMFSSEMQEVGRTFLHLPGPCHNNTSVHACCNCSHVTTALTQRLDMNCSSRIAFYASAYISMSCTPGLTDP
jgi:hypothetical protein